ncbi:helix-turn-helix transcriptional regulator [Aquimarina sp. U1-2]|uniref:helix-turn-helix domain-containing protein n=1 Tax=Aquimarina sp. U1-2 TaxID=2823141 RepID=UPI001AECCF20|nr:AraC family transcriptional regulator [Aquimarina sp. U1-2]MBP2832910.1 helix-turn-helix transcriptional regulator [Aquimarina sp. U1-2]
MSLTYKDTFYNHFEKKTFDIPPHYSHRENFLMRYKASFTNYDFLENCLTVIFFNNGNGAFYNKEKVLKAKDNSFLILNPNEGWEFINEQLKYIDVLSFGISNQLSNDCFYYLKSHDKTMLDNPFNSSKQSVIFLEKTLKNDYYNTGKLLKAIYNTSNTNNYPLLCPEELTFEVLKSISKEQALGNKIIKTIDAKKLSTKQETLKRLLVAYEYIHDNIYSDIKMDQLSNVSSLSKFHLYDSFKNAFGKTPHQYINRLKLKKAKQLLQTREISITEVSTTLGFSDSSSFSKIFKKAYGKAPSNFLKTSSTR